LFTLALALSGQPENRPFTVDAAISVLHEHGLPPEIPRNRLAHLIRESTAADPAFVAFNESTFVVDRRFGLPRPLGAVISSSRVWAARRPAPVREAPRARPGARASTRAPTSARAPTSRKASRPEPPSPPRAPEAVPIPEPPALVPAAFRFLGLDEADL